MFIIVSLDALLLILGILMMLGFASAVSLGVWLLNHALIVGITLLVIRGLSTYVMASQYNCNWICTLLYFLTAPAIIITQYVQLRATNNDVFSIEDSTEMLFLSIFLLIVDTFWEKAAEKSKIELFTFFYMPYIFFALFLYK